MSTPEALEAYVGFNVQLPSGVIVSARPLPLKKALEYMKRLGNYRASPDDKTTNEQLVPMIEEFPDLVHISPREAYDALSFGEAVNTIRAFFSHVRKDAEIQKNPTPDPVAETPSSSPPSPSPST